MDDNARNTASYQLDQEILDARGINMTVEEVAGLPTCKYADRVHSLKLNEEDLAFLKGLRRRIKNRLASQNSRRRSVEHLRRLTRELRALQACQKDALLERRALEKQRDTVRDQCVALRRYLVQTLHERSDITEVPLINTATTNESQTPKEIKKVTVKETVSPILAECFTHKLEKDKNIFQCCIDKLVQQSVNHMFKTEVDDRKKIFAKTIFITNDKMSSSVKSVVLKEENGIKGLLEEGGVLNLSVKEGRRRSHGRKQSAPRRIVYAFEDNNDDVLDLKVKKENQ